MPSWYEYYIMKVVVIVQLPGTGYTYIPEEGETVVIGDVYTTKKRQEILENFEGYEKHCIYVPICHYMWRKRMQGFGEAFPYTAEEITDIEASFEQPEIRPDGFDTIERVDGNLLQG